MNLKERLDKVASMFNADGPGIVIVVRSEDEGGPYTRPMAEEEKRNHPDGIRVILPDDLTEDDVLVIADDPTNPVIIIDNIPKTKAGVTNA